MNKEFLRKQMWEAHYALKKGTNSTYLYQPYLSIEDITNNKLKREATTSFIKDMEAKGEQMLLPFRICFITGEDSAPVRKSGRGLMPKVAQLKAGFTKPEVSPYKLAKPYRVCTSIWQMEGYKCFFYGTIGITFSENQKPKDNGDLIVIYTSDWDKVSIYIFKGLAKPNDSANLQDIAHFLEDIVIFG